MYGMLVVENNSRERPIVQCSYSGFLSSPKIHDLLASLDQGKVFLNWIWLILISKSFLMNPDVIYALVNAHKGFYQYNSLHFGVSSVPLILQCTMEGVLQGITNVCVYLDNILIAGLSKQEHVKILDRVLQRMKEARLRLKTTKCSFMKKSMEYLKLSISAEGLCPIEETVHAILEAPEPQNVLELRSFMEVVNYYGEFLPQLSTLLAPPNELLQNDKKWNWGQEKEKAF